MPSRAFVSLIPKVCTRAPESIFTAFDTAAMLMDADNLCIDHLYRAILGYGEGFHDGVAEASRAPADEAIVAGRIGAKGLRQIAHHGAPDRKTQKVPLRTRR